MPRKKSSKIGRPRKKLLKDPKIYTETEYKERINSLVREGLSRQAERDSVNKKLAELNHAYESSKKVWNQQEERMWDQIKQERHRNELLEQEKSNLWEVIFGLGEVLGRNKSEIINLRFFKEKKYEEYIGQVTASATNQQEQKSKL